MDKSEESRETHETSLALGGPLYNLLVRSWLHGAVQWQLKRRIVMVTLFAWMPLVLLSLLDGKALGGVRVSFFGDAGTQLRFLLGLPLLILAEPVVHERVRYMVQQFTDQGIIPAASFPRFNAILKSSKQLRNSLAVEIVLLLAIFIGGHFLWSSMDQSRQDVTTWYATRGEPGTRLTPAGYWYVFVSRPIFQFLYFRWYFRLFIWARLLWQVSRLDLHLVPTRPDRAAGLGFLAEIAYATALLLLVQGVGLAALIANQILYSGATLLNFKLEVVSVLTLVLLLVLGPLLVFTPHLIRARQVGLCAYGKLESRYVEEFEKKWVHGHPAAATLLGSSDLQSLADLGNSMAVVRDMRPFVFTKESVLHVVVLTLLPVLLIVLMTMPLEELLTKLASVIF